MSDSVTEFAVAGIIICLGFIARTVQDKLKKYLNER